MKYPRFRLSLSSRGLRVGFAVLSGVFVSVPLLRCNLVRAAADDPVQTEYESVSLSPEQTLALYGTTLTAEYFTGSSVETVNLEYIGNTFELSQALAEQAPEQAGYTYFSNWYMNDFANGWLSATRARESCWLIYRWNVAEIATAAQFDFSLRLTPSVSIQAYGIGQAVMWSRSSNSVYPGVNAGLSQYASSFTLYGDTIQDVLARGSYLARPNVGSEYGIARTYVTPCRFYNTVDNPVYYYGTEIQSTFLGMSAFAGARYADPANEPLTLRSEDIKIKLERPVTQATGVRNTESGYEFYDFTQPAVYILLQCPVLYGDYLLPPNNSGSGVDLTQIEEYLNEQIEISEDIKASTVESTTYLLHILYELQRMHNDMVTYSQIQTLVNSQTTGILSGIQGLFVPSQSDIIAFDTNMRNLIATTFLGVSDAKEIVDDSYSLIGQQTAVQTVDFPLIDLRSAGVNFAMDARSLQASGLTVQNGKIKVPLRPREQEWHTFYEMAAYAIDIIVTIAVINMLLNRFRALLVGEKVVEIDDN